MFGECIMEPYYETKLGKLYHGDCLEIMPLLEPVDLVLTDPPYLNLSGGLTFIQGSGVGCFNHKIQSKTVGDPWNATLEWVRPAYGLAVNGFLSFCSYHFLSELRMELKEHKPLCLLVWHKRNTPVTPANTPRYTEEFIWAFSKKPKIRWRQLKKTMFDIPKLATGCMAPKERFLNKDKTASHPTQKPLWLIMQLIDLGADSVLDPFIGTGTTAVACERLNRRWIGIEIEEKYCEIAAKRIEQETKQLKLW